MVCKADSAVGVRRILPTLGGGEGDIADSKPRNMGSEGMVLDEPESERHNDTYMLVILEV